MSPPWLLLLGLSLVVAACHKESDATAPMLVLDTIGLEIPQLQGWHPEPVPRITDPAKGGLLLRLVRESKVPGAPRVDVRLAPLGTRPAHLESFLTENLKAMGELEGAGQIRIVDVSQESIRVGSIPAYRVRHNYTMNQGSSQISISQVSAFVVLGERGVTITAAGRTELFHAVANSVESMINGLRVVGDSNNSLPVDVLKLEESKNKGGPAAMPEQLRPVD